MTTETYLDLTYERGKGAKRPPRPKLLKLTDVSIPHRSRKKSKVKTKDRSATLVRERIYDDPAYTEDISHLANPIRRGSVPENHSAEQKSKCDIPGQTASSRSLLSKHQLPKELHQYVSAKQSKYKGANSASAPSGSTAANVNYDCGSSSSDNETMEPAKASSMTRRVRSLERSLATERSDKKGPQKRNSKQKRNLSLDNSRYLHPGHPQHSALVSKPSHDFEDQAPSRKKYNESSVEAVQTEASEVDDVETAADAAAKVAIGKRFLRGEIGIKSFNYYLLKEGLKSSKKIVTKQRNTLYSGEPDAKSEKIATRSEENIYEEIFFKDTLGTVTTSITELATSSAPPQPPDKEAHNHLQQVQKGGPKVPPHVMSGPSEGSAVGVFADCEICMEQCSKDNCEYCLAHAVQGVGKRHSQQPKQTSQQEPLINQAYHNENNDPLCSSSRVGLPAAHILEFQSYNPNNPGVYKIETTPVAITGDYNPILQFQQSSATTSTSTTTTPSDQQQPQQQQQQHIQPHQLQKPIYGGYYHPQSHQKPYHTTIVGKPLTSQYAIGGSLLLAPVAGSAAAQGSVPPRRPQQQQQQQYIVSYQNGGSVAGGASLQLLNTKSSSSSDSLTQHKYNTITRLEANVFAAPNTGDLYYAVGGTAPLHPLMYAASRPIGGSQILVDPYDPPQMYKSDSKASILSEFSLRSSDNSQRYVRYGPHRRHGGGRVSDSSLFSIYSNSGQRRYFGSSESRLGYDCRRCSLDGIIGMGSGTAMGATTVPPDKCSYSDNCRYECRNCDCSSNYFSSDFDDMYGSIARGGSSGIPRKTAAGTLPSSFQDNSTDLKEKSKTPPSLLQQQFSAPLDLKQNKYAQDFFKHVNDVKRSIYQSEMQRNNSLESSRRGPRAGGNNTNSRSSPKRAVSQEPTEPVVTTLPLSRGRPAAGVRPTPAPRTSLQSQPVLPATFIPRDPTPTKRRSQPSGRREFPSLDRLVASNTGTIPKRHSRTMAGSESQSPKFTSKPKGFDAKDAWTGSNVEEQFTPGKRHHRTSSTKSHQNVPGPVTRRKDIPAPPPPSPATYSDLQELKANMEGLQDDTKSRSLESETSESPAVPSPSVRSLTGSHNEKKTRELAEAPLKISIALTDMNIPAEFCSTVSGLGHPAIGPDIGSVEQEDNDVFYDARSEDSGAGSLPTEVCLPQSKGAFGLVACSQEAAGGKGSQETIYSERENSTKDVNTLPHTDPIAEGSEPDTPQGNDIGIASDDAKSKKQGRSTVEEQITPHDVEKLVGMDTCLQTESEITEATLRGKHEEESSKARDDEKTQTSAIEQHAAATCLEEKQTSLPATPTVHGVSNAGNINSNDAPASTSVSGNATDVDVDVDFQFSCNTDSNVYVTYLPVVNTDSAALTHSDRTVDIPVLVTTAGIPAQSRTLTRQDYACLDSSEAQSDDSHLTRDSVTRESQNDELSSSTLEKLDVSTLPLPALPKRRRPRSRTSPSKNLQHRQRHEAIENANANETSPASSRQQHLKPRQRVDTPEKQKSEISQTLNPAPQKQHLSAFQQYVAKRRESLEASNRSFNEKLEARRMHYQLGGGNAANVTTGANSGVPTYLFGDHFQALGGGGPSSGRKSLSPATNKEEIYLNKSGWVQVNTKREGFKEDSCSGYRRQQNDSTACVLQDNGRSRAAGRVIPMDAQGHRTDLAHYSFIYQHQQLKSNVGIAEPKFVGSKVEELIQRNEARLGGFSSRDPALRPGYRIIDPQMASILNERPGFLPVKSPNDLDSPITPILSPPPAFQDNSRTTHQVERPLPLPVLQSEARQSPQHMANGSVKGMVFSRSFEYDTRRPTPTNSYVQTFSRSFDGHLSELPLHLGMPPLAGQRERSPNFSTLTGNSPNYLTKRESGGGSSGSLRSRDSSPKLLSPQTTTAYLNASVKEAPPAYSMSCGGAATIGTQAKYSPRSRHERSSERSKIHALGRSRKSQFNRMGSAGPPAAPPSSLGMGASRFRSFDTTKSQRLNSCDSGARSDLSNDELDNEDGGLSEFLSAGNQKFPKPCSSIVSISPFKMQRQRSLTPDRNESHSSSSSLRKQRSLTPESRSLTPEERRKKGSQLSLLGSRQSSGSRNNTLEARQRNGEKTSPNISRSSSSSSYSGGDSHDCLNASTTSIVAGGLPCPIPGSGPTNHRRAIAAAQSAAKQAEQEHRIRRSRSLQLSERSPNRVHKSIVNVSAVSAHQPQQQPKQPPAPSYQQPRLGVRAVFPPTVRTPPAANKIPAPLSASTRNTTRPRKNEADKARSFDFDYNNFNRSAGSKAKSPRSIHTGGSGGDSGGNQNQRIERESRSFDEEYREAVLNNNNGSSGSISGVRYLQPAADSGLVPTGSSSTSRLRQSSSPVNGSGVEYTASRSPKSSGSSSNNLHQPTRKTGSPQSYGTRLCDHELTFEMLRKSPIMNFRRGESSDFEPPVLLRNRETINSGGNSELNFMSNETRIYEHPTTVLKPQRSLRQSSGSRDDLPLEVAVGVGGDYIYRPAPTQPRSSSASSHSNESTTTKSFSKTLTTCDYWPRCGACQEKATPGEIKRQYSLPVVTTLNQEPELQPHITTVAVNIPNVETKAEKLRPCVAKSIIPQWTFLCSGVADCRPQEHSAMTTNENERRQLMAVVRPRVVPSASTSLFLLGVGNLCLAKAAESEKEAGPQVLTVAEIGLRNLQDEHEFTEVNKKCRWRERSLSLPSPTIQRYSETEKSMPKTGNRGVKVVGKGSSNNTFAGGLSQQMRAVSSPSLTEPYSESRKLPVESTTPADGSATVATITSSGSGGGGVGLGVLLKFKRTFNNFNNKNQFHTPALPTSAASNGNLPKSKSSPTTPSVAITTAGTVTTNDCAGTDGGDGSYGRYRFGPLIWRTSRERRKTKFNRRDKCNSGDSGIQIELDHDEQYSRVLAVGAQGDGVRQGETIASSNTSIGSESKTRTIRRTNSAKASSILGSVTLKSKNHMQLDFGGTDNIEREAPESLPTRSLSQPNGLEAYGIGYPDMADSDSDSIASHEEATSYYSTIYAEVLYNFTAGGPQELGLERGMLIEILRKEVGPWWFGRIKKEETNRVDEILDPELGWFPKEFVRIIQCPETDRFFNAHQGASDAEQASTTAEEAGDSVPVSVADFPKDADVTMATDQSNITTIIIEAPPLSSNEVFTGNVLDNETVLRRGAIRELLDTEVNYVKLLAAICDGYLPAMSKRIDIFSPNSIRLIFSNITAIYKFQAKFLDSLRKGIEQNQIAKVFLKMHKGFLCYSNYCNAYSRALIELESYDRVKDARTILENCRESENLAELPLSAHLLAPVQRICRYPLHLNEIIKSALVSSPETRIDKLKGSSSSDYEQLDVNEIDIPDTYATVNLALEAMRGITEAVNEGKRHSETIARHQASFQNFKGPPLHLHSARFFLQVDATRQKQNLWNSSYTLFLFDNQLVYCKRDIIKRSHFIYKGRIFLDRCRVVNVRDGKMFGHTIKNSLRIYCESRDKWYDFSFRSANRKHRFLNTLALERQFGGKALYVSEMTGFEYNYEERPGDFSDQSDYELPDFEHALCATSASGESSVPESPAKSASRFCDTLPKKSQSRDGIASVDNSQMLSTTTSTGSLGRRRIGNWFRKPKSSNCTPSQSPTHKPVFDADETLTAARVAAIELAEADAALLPTDSSSA